MMPTFCREPWNRRRFLRGGSRLLALPLLEAFIPLAGRAAESAPRPRRLAFVYSPNGAIMDRWTPGQPGRLGALPPTLAPLAAHRAHIQVLTGLDHRKAAANGDGAGDHARANATFLTGVQARKTAGADIRLGRSVDQEAARVLGEASPLPSLELGCDRVRTSGTCDSGYSCAYQFNLSWRDEQTPLPPECDPALVFDRLFPASNQTVQAERGLRKSVLDAVMADARQLERTLGRRDRQKLDQYLTAVRAAEKQIDRDRKLDVQQPRPDGIPGAYRDHLRLMYDLMALAFQTDVTRIASFLSAHDGSNRRFKELGIPEGHHQLSHHNKDPKKIEQLARIDHFYVEQFAAFLQRLRDIEEGPGTLLDQCMIVYGSGISDANRHDHNNLPVILAGGGGGSLHPGEHRLMDGHVPMSNLYVALLQRMGLSTSSFGDSTGCLEAI